MWFGAVHFKKSCLHYFLRVPMCYAAHWKEQAAQNTLQVNVQKKRTLGRTLIKILQRGDVISVQPVLYMIRSVERSLGQHLEHPWLERGASLEQRCWVLLNLHISGHISPCFLSLKKRHQGQKVQFCPHLSCWNTELFPLWKWGRGGCTVVQSS